MRYAYFQPVSGIAGNMIIGACLDAGLAWETLSAILQPLAIGEWAPIREQVARGGMRGTYFNVEVDDPIYRPGAHTHSGPAHRQQVNDEEEHAPHRHYPDVVALVEGATHLSPRVRNLALDALRRIGEAESMLHGVALDELHLHEIGAMDTIIDVVGSMAALELLGIERVYADAVHVGTGHRTTAHGVVPIPTPATLAILGDHPVVMDRPGFELATPTGAAILMALLHEHQTRDAAPPAGRVVTTGWGAGSADLPDRPNLLRMVIADSTDGVLDDPRWQRDRIVALRAHVDDLSPERYPPLTEALLQLGAVDVTTTPTIMKGGRPGVILEVLCPEAVSRACVELLFREGVTLGLRVDVQDRVVLRRETVELELKDGAKVAGKVAYVGEEVVRTKPEIRQVVQHAQESGQAVGEVAPEGNSYGEFDNVEFILSLLKATE